jgi:hypothetical protein
MSIVKTFGDMKSEVRHLAAESSPGQFFENVIPESINNAAVQAFNKGVQANEDPFIVKAQRALVNNIDVYPLRSLFYGWAKIRYVEYVTTAGINQALEPIDLDEKDEYYYGLRSPSQNVGTPAQFYVVGQLIYVIPTPNVAGFLRIHYVRMPSKLVNDTDTTIIPANHQEMLVYGGLVRCKHKDEEAVGPYLKHFDTLEFNYVEDLRERQTMTPRYIKEQDYMYNSLYGFGPW